MTNENIMGVQNVQGHVIIGAQKHTTGSHAYFTATNAVQSACVCHLVLMATRKNVLAITTGKPRKANLNVLNLLLSSFFK